MSVETLLCENKPTLGLRPFIEAADQLYFRDQRVLSNVKPETSGHEGQSGSSGEVNQNQGGQQQAKNDSGRRSRQNSHGNKGSDKGGDKVRQAINDAKQTANQARSGNHNNRSRCTSNKSESGDVAALRQEINELKEENTSIRKEIEELRQMVLKYANVSQTSGQKSGSAPESKKEAAPTPAKEEKAGDDDFDLFGSDEEDDEDKQRLTEERLKAYAEKKSKKPGPIAKSNIIYDVKPWDDQINIDDIEKAVRGIEMDGLVWGAAKKVPVAFGIVKLQICCVVEDNKVSSDALEEAICDFEELVQSVDVVAFNKV